MGITATGLRFKRGIQITIKREAAGRADKEPVLQGKRIIARAAVRADLTGWIEAISHHYRDPTPSRFVGDLAEELTRPQIHPSSALVALLVGQGGDGELFVPDGRMFTGEFVADLVLPVAAHVGDPSVDTRNLEDLSFAPAGVALTASHRALGPAEFAECRQRRPWP